MSKTTDFISAMKLGTDFGAKWHGGQKSEGRSVREFVPYTRLIAAPDTWARICAYRQYKSLQP